MKPKGIVFDFNGTLFFDNDKHVKAWGAIAELIRGTAVTEEELHTKCNGVPNKEIIAYFSNGTLPEEEVTRYSFLKEEYYRKFCKEDTPTFHLVEGVEQFFDYLKENNIPFTIASASIKPNIDFFVDSFRLDRWIDPANIVYDDGTYANKIDMFLDASEVLGVDFHDCMVYEDSASGVRSAYEAGCRKIVVMNSANQRDMFMKMSGVERIIDSFVDECKAVAQY